MKRRFALGSLALALLVARPALGDEAGVRAIDPHASKALFAIGHLYLTKVEGTVPILAGTVTMATGTASPLRVEAVLQPAGIRTGDDERDGDLQGDDWFDTKRFPKWTYDGTAVKTDALGHVTIDGTLTVHGVRQPVSLDVTVVRGLPDPVYHAVGHADRHAFGMTVTRTDALVGTDITIVLDVAVRP